MRIGVVAGVVSLHYDLDTIIKKAQQAEEDGFDHYWFVHLPHIGFDALTMVTLAGRNTIRIELGTAVVPTYPRHPHVMAQQAMTAQVASGGRLTLGIGPSHDFVIEGMLGMDYEKPAKHTREYLEILQAFNNNGNVKHDGEIFRVKAELSVNGAQPFRVMVAALGPKMLKLTGELADGTITWMTGPKTVESHIVPRISKAAQDAGRPAPRVAVTLPIMLTNNKQAGKERVNELLGSYGKMTNYRRMLEIEGVETPGDVAIMGTETEIEETLRRYADLGVTDYLALIIPEKEDPEGSLARTWDTVKELVGKIG